MNRFFVYFFKSNFFAAIAVSLGFLHFSVAAQQPTKTPARRMATKTPIVLIHGIGGSDLTYRPPVKTDERGLTSNGFPNDVLKFFPGKPQNLQLDEFGKPRPDSISPNIKAVKFYDVPRVKNITDLSKFLQRKNYVKDAELFEFFYDFRFSVENNAKELAAFVDSIVAQSGKPEVDIIAHSMGGLIAKQYLIDQPDSNLVRNLVFVGVPHLGAPKALKVLRYGDNLDVFVIDGCKLKRVAHNMPSIFSLLPGKKYFELTGKGYFTDDADLDGDGARGTLDYEKTLYNLAKGKETRCKLNPRVDMPPFDNLSPFLIENSLVKFHEKQDDWVKPANTKVFAIAGYGLPTINGITEDDDKVIYSYTTAGDGTVPLVSAETVSADRVYYVNLARLKSDHSQMIGSKAVIEQIAEILATGDTRGKTDFETTRPAANSFKDSSRVSEN